MVYGMPAFGNPIQREIAEKAYCELVMARLISPAAVLRTRWDKLVLLLDRAHYITYDFSTATKLVEVSEQLKRRYGGLTNLLALARTASELSRKLQQLKHIQVLRHEPRLSAPPANVSQCKGSARNQRQHERSSQNLPATFAE